MPEIIEGAKYLTIPMTQRSLTNGYIADVDAGSWMSPLQPMKPVAPVGTRVRQYGYTQGANIDIEPTSSVAFWLLRQFVENWDLLHIVIDTVCDKVCNAPWEVRLVRDSTETNKDYKARTKDAMKELVKARAFVACPDSRHAFADWLRMWFEDLMVIDAAAIYMVRDTKGRIAEWMPIDGATITRRITDQGVTPNDGKSIAYQQILYGNVASDMTSNDLVYYMANERTWQRYGCSPVQKIVTTIATGIRREQFVLKYFTEGNMPEALCFLPAEMPIKKLKEVQDWFDSVMSGNLSNRRRLTFLPGYGMGGKAEAKPNVVFPKEVLLKDPIDEWLWQVACYAIGTTPAGMLKMMNRATAESSSDVSEEEGIEPKKRRVERVINMILQQRMGLREIEFAFSQRREMDPKTQMEIDTGYSGKAVIRINEIREDLGRDPDPCPEANMLGVVTENGFIPLTAGIIDAGAGGSKPLELNSLGEAKQKAAQDAADAKAKQLGNGAPKKKKPVKKSAKMKLGVPASNPRMQLAYMKLYGGVLKVFQHQKEKAKLKAGTFLKALKKSDDSDEAADKIWKEIKIEFADLPPVALEALESAAKAGISNGIFQLQLADGDMISKLNQGAVDWAKARAAEMVGMKWNDEDELIPNPSAKWNIAQTTRDEIKKAIAKAFEEETTTAELIASVEEAISEAEVFSEDRAALIARTETVNAATGSNYEVWKASGVVTQVEWDVSSLDPCPICEGNDGIVVDLGQPFPSGDIMPTAHPRCACLLIAVGFAE